ncbi:MAG: hypothetical protein QN122_04920 [Armatimonadota bacterium]|nr:hypothetical protein [Armatimonadota bacterium]MDR7449311.1 hypothetical protein [Armatimonadota bacterium]MDR7458758.1 hypothetical protein [Armatimonadota bacterium]MDR7479976.1 hypothetical protein [Armatimonadota bacterium]MDR7488634.1 hypothetical protein [Armatimonadota bacterium]
MGSAEEAAGPLPKAADLYEALEVPDEAARLRRVLRGALAAGHRADADLRAVVPRSPYRRSNGTTQTSPV